MARRHTPYYHKLVALDAELVDRIGYDAALRFTSVAEEHLATRERVGVYDVYHQARWTSKAPMPRRSSRTSSSTTPHGSTMAASSTRRSATRPAGWSTT